MTERNQAHGIVVEVGTATVRMGPVGFSLYAEEFLKASAAIPEHSQARGNTEFTPVPYYLLCRALELILKAFLLGKGRPLDELKHRYGHDLGALWQAAKDQRLFDVLGTCPPYFEIDLQSVNSFYRSKVFEYFDFRQWAHGYEGLPPLGRLRDETTRIVERIKYYCFSVA